MVFKQHVAVPDDSEVFKVIRSGTFDMLLNLFDKGLASPLSVDNVYGSTLLHVSNSTEPLLNNQQPDSVIK